jgi:alpha/beta superfamily hydrolase
MRDRVVVAAERGFVAGGLSTLRFNFRGAGRSPGRHDGGRGERDDVRAALGFLDEHVPHGPLVVAGYSFGCAVGLSVGAEHPRAAALMGVGVSFLLLAPPTLEGFEGAKVFVQGDRDELGPLAEVRPWVEALAGDARLIVVPGADHFFAGPLADTVGRAAEALAREIVNPV